MDTSLFANLPWKRYVRYSLFAVIITLVIYCLVFFFTHTFYILRVAAPTPYEATVLTNENKSHPVTSIGTLYAIPRDTRVLTVSTKTATTKQSTQYITAPEDLPLGFKELALTLNPQREVSSNGVDMGCASGDYPNVIGYSCTNPTGIYQMTSANYIDTPLIHTLPPLTIDAYVEGSNVNTATLSITPYRHGALVLSTDITENKFGNYKLLFYTNDTEIQTYPIDLPEISLSDSQYTLIPDTSGGESFGIFSPKDKSLLYFKTPGTQPVNINTVKPTHNAEGVTCGINGATVTCFTGKNYMYSDSEAQNAHHNEEFEGSVTTYDSTGKQVSQWKTPKDAVFQSICYGNGRFFALSDNNRLLTALPSQGKELRFMTLFDTVDGFSCSKQPTYIYNGSIYQFDGINHATMIYSNSELPATSLSVSGDHFNFSANTPARKGAGLSLHLNTTTVAHDKKRVSDIVASVLTSTSDEFYDFHFNPESVNYILLDPEADAALKKKLLDESKKRGLPFTPNFPQPSLITKQN